MVGFPQFRERNRVFLTVRKPRLSTPRVVVLMPKQGDMLSK